VLQELDRTMLPKLFEDCPAPKKKNLTHSFLLLIQDSGPKPALAFVEASVPIESVAKNFQQVLGMRTAWEMEGFRLAPFQREPRFRPQSLSSGVSAQNEAGCRAGST